MVDHINKDRFADSAGTPWEGRSFDQNSFSDDDGTAPENLIKVIADFRQGIVAADKVVDELRVSRLLVPLLANLGESEIGANGQLVDKSAELSIVTVRSPDDQDSLVAFSSVLAMTAWNPTARPVPTDAIRVTLAAASQMSTRVVLDPGSDTEFVIRRPAIAKIAQSLPWLSPEVNPEVEVVIAESVAGESVVIGFDLKSADPEARLAGPELQIELKISKGTAPEEARSMIERVSEFWSKSEVFASAVDSVSIKLLAS